MQTYILNFMRSQKTWRSGKELLLSVCWECTISGLKCSLCLTGKTARVIYCSVGSWRAKWILNLWYCISFISSPLPALVHAYPSHDHTGQCNRNHCDIPGQANSWKSKQIKYQKNRKKTNKLPGAWFSKLKWEEEKSQ